MSILVAQKRDIFGKKLQAGRQAGSLPAVAYGAKSEAKNLLIDAKEFKKIYRVAGESTLINIKIGDESLDALIHQVSFHPVSGEPIHVDFYLVDKNKVVTVAVPLEFVGISPAVKQLGGVLVKVLHELEVEAPAKDLPHNLEVDLSKLETLDSKICVADIILPKNVTATADPEEIVASVGEAGEEVVETISEPADLSKIEVEKKGKKEEEVVDSAE